MTIGRFSFVGAGAVVTSSVPDYALVVGVPARQIGWMSEYGEQLDLPLSGSAEALCPHTHASYRLEGQSLTRTPLENGATAVTTIGGCGF